MLRKVFKRFESNVFCVKHLSRGYSCVCPEGYTGEFCDLEVDLCKLYMQKVGFHVVSPFPIAAGAHKVL